ncbi:kinectin-like isoform X1 [Carassius carassius]|uniref:kinectin-like isoform X1 n=1 Tax=Carassius carassius TaxID=217509 RepID=UPI002868C131|nr:kinectin-like isoform X1 [Carassius carassius]XP_059376773.1 kinectin-like isoform X1 [Carassius carassius]
MALDMADSQYLLILAPSLVIALMFLFFWLFMKETSYDEVLARQKRDLKLPPTKPDTRKKNEKKKNKKKETGGNGVGGGGESEEDLRDFDTSDGAGPTSNDEDSEAVPVSPPVAAPVLAEPPSGIRERKKREKKPKASPAAVPTKVPLSRTTPTTPPASEVPEVNGSKPAVRKEQPLPLTKQSSPPQPQATPPAPTETTSKKKAKKQKSESEEHPPEIKPDLSPPVVKKEVPVIIEVEIKAKERAAPITTAAPTPPTASSGSGRRKKKQKLEPVVTVDEAHVQSSAPVTESTTSTNHQSNQNNEAPPPAPAPTKHSKKQKSETNKENSEVKLKELLASLSGLVLSDSDVVSLVSLLRDKSPNALDSWYKSAAKFEPSAQQLAEKDRLLSTLQEEVSIAKGKVKQLSQELQAEKQKSGRVESVLHEHRVAREKDIMQVKAQSYQEMQIKFQQLREQLEGQIARLQQENGILRDAVERCSTSTQMENKQTSELNKLHSEYSGLMKELAETKNKLQQEELQRKSLEVNYKQNMSQLEDAKRRWEELQNYLHNVNAEREKHQASKQELQNQLMTAESEVTSKNKEIQNLHSNLKETLIFKEQEQQKVKQLEQQVMQLLEASQHDQLQEQVQDLLNENKALKVQIDNLQARLNTQATAVSHFDELQKLLADKELQRKSLEDSLNAERSSSAGRETKMQAIHNENLTLKTDLQNLQAQISEQAVSVDQLKQSLQQRDDKVRVVENLLESSLIQVANKEAELKAVKNEYEGLKQQQLEAVQKQTSEQTMSEKTLEELQQKIQEKDEKIRSVEESMQSAVDKESERKKAVEDLQQQVETLNTELAQLRSRETQESDLNAKLQELHAQLTAKDQDVERLQRELEKEVHQQQQTVSTVPSPELLTALAEKDQRLSELQEELQELRESVELHRMKNNELREKNWSAMEALSVTETILQGKLAKSAKEHQTVLESTEAECRALLHSFLPHVPLPTDQNHQQWLQTFETSVRESLSGELTSDPASGAGDAQALAEKLKEAEEAQKVLQKDCETYKKVLAETEGILQRLQSSVEQEETRWREKLEQSHADLREMTQRVIALEQEVDRLSSDGDVESLRRDKQHLEAELERAERESATYVSEVRELRDLLTELQSKLDGSYTEAVRQNEELTLLKIRLTETLCKLETEESERQKVAGDLYKAQQSLELIQAEIVKEAGQADLIETSGLTQTEEFDRKEKMTAGLNQTVQDLQELLQSVNRQLTKGNERDDGDKVYSNYKL